MSPAVTLRDRSAVRMLVVGGDGRLQHRTIASLPELLDPTDVVVLNDAATLPASLRVESHNMELRLAAEREDGSWFAVLLGEGTWRIPTENRRSPPPVAVGEQLVMGRPGVAQHLTATVESVSTVSPRLLIIRFHEKKARLWQRLYALGKPIQYAYHREPLPLWAVQSAFSARPWAVEPPSAGLGLTLPTVQRLRERGVAVCTVTHAAGLSSTGDAALDRALPLPERFEIPDETARAIAVAKRRGGRVIAIGTTVTRALESAARAQCGLVAQQGVARLRLGPESRLLIVDGILSGMHIPGESHHLLMRAFVDDEQLADALRLAEVEGYLSHELGDTMLVLPQLNPGAGNFVHSSRTSPAIVSSMAASS